MELWPDAQIGLAFHELDEWRRWQRAQEQATRRVKRRINSVRRPLQEAGLVARRWNPGASRTVAVGLDGNRSSLNAAVTASAEALIAMGIDVVMVGEASSFAAVSRPARLSSPDLVKEIAANIGAALSAGDHMPFGSLVHHVARAAGRNSFVVQHGIITPWSPPPTEGSYLLAWSDADLRFWRAHHRHLPGQVVGSQLLWLAQKRAHHAMPADASGGVIFLGQLHGAELTRKTTRETVADLRIAGPLEYRAHPGEVDVHSRLQHALWRAQGVDVVIGRGLADTNRPVLAHFSTGLLEAAALGLPAYAYCANPPPWLQSLWNRYRLSVWKDERVPTEVGRVEDEPAQLVARIIADELH